MTVDREQEILNILQTWSLDAITKYADLVEAENTFIEAFTQGGMFPDLLPELVKLTRKEIIETPKEYLEGLLKFFRLIAGQGLAVESDTKAPIPKEMYIARLVAQAEGDYSGIGLNYLFTPGDPAIDDIRLLYARNNTTLKVSQLVMPFTVLWSDGFYYRGLEITKGDVTSDSHLPTFEFQHMEQTWAQIQTHAGIFELC